MAQPVAYIKSTNFQQEEANNVAGRSTVRTARVDVELAGIELTLSQTLANLAIIQRDDTGLKDLIVTTESLSANVKALHSAAGVVPRGAWLTATSYAVKDVVETGAPLVSYICVIAHTSGTFATDRTAGRWMVLGAEPGTGTFTAITLTTGGVTLGTNNTQDLAATANRFRSGYFGTSLFASVSVVTPLVNSAAGLTLQSTSGFDAVLETLGNNSVRLKTNGIIRLTVDLNGLNLNGFGTIDSGTAASLSLKTNNGTTGFEVIHRASGVTRWRAVPGLTANEPILEAAGETNTGGLFDSFGTGGFKFRTDSTGSGVGAIVAAEIVRVAAATRWIKWIPSNGGNPTLDVSAGSLAITPAVVMAGTLQATQLTLSDAASRIIPGATSLSLRNNANTLDNLLITDAGVVTARAALVVSGASISIGTTPAVSGGNGSILIPNAGQIRARNAANSADMTVAEITTINAIADVIRIGPSGVVVASAGTIIRDRASSGVPTVSDLPASFWMLWRDNAGLTTRLYYNNAGVLQSVALA